MAGQQVAVPATTSTAVVQGQWRYSQSQALCVDRDGHLYLTQHELCCVYKVHRQRGRYSVAAVLSGSAEVEGGRADGHAANARFSSPCGLCVSPVDPDTLLVMDGGSVRGVDVVTGAAFTLAHSRAGVQPRCLEGCASDGRHHVWVMDCDDEEEDYRLLRLDMRSPEFHQGPLAEGCDINVLLCCDDAGNAICGSWHKPQLWRVRPDGTTTLLAGTDEPGYRDGPAAEAQFGHSLCAAAAGDGSIVVSDKDNRRLRLVSPGGTVSTLAGSGEEDGGDGPLAEAQFRVPAHLVLSPDGDVLVFDHDYFNGVQLLLRTVPVGLPPLPHLAPQPAAPHPAAQLNGGLLQSGLLADAVVRVVAARGAAQQQGTGQPAAAQGDGDGVLESGPAGAAHSVGDGVAGTPSSLQISGPDPSSSIGRGYAAAVDIPCHRNILAAACAYFKALFVGPLAQQQHTAATTAGSGDSTAGRKRKAAGGQSIGAGACEPFGAAASSSGMPAVTVVTVEGASADAVRAVLRHVYTGSVDLGGVTASTAQDVLHLAQQWGLDGLLEACQAYVAEQLLGPGNAAEWLVCAEGRQYGTIRAAAMRAVVEHIDAVHRDEAQLALLTANPMLLVEALMLSRGVSRHPV